MIDRQRAVSIAKRRLGLRAPGVPELALDESRTVEFDGGWLFFYNSACFLKTGRPGDADPGNVPFIIGRKDGILRLTHPPFGSVEEMIAVFGERSATAANDPLEKAIWHALYSSQFRLALINGRARKYRASVAPFAVVDENSVDALEDLAELLAPGDAVYVPGEKPAATERLRWDGIVPCLQMLFPPKQPLPEAREGLPIEELTCAHSREMMELIAVAFPGYFREETCLMGRYLGVREGGKLIAMAGERMVLEAGGVMWREISALCTHPAHTGKGLGTALLRHVIQTQRDLGAMPFLHVVDSNTHAIRLYAHYGFKTLRLVEMHRLVREA